MLKLATPPGKFALSVETFDLQVSSEDFMYIILEILLLMN